MTIRYFKFLKIILLCIAGLSAGARQDINTIELARKVVTKGLKEINLETYQGSLLLQGMAELAITSGDNKMLEEVIGTYQKFSNNKIQGKGSFISYSAGGNGAAFLTYHKSTQLLDVQVTNAALKMFLEQRRSKEGILTTNWASKETDQVFIDMAFAVTPFMLYAGLSQHKEEYIDLSILETLELFRILEDRETGLLHQARGFGAPGKISEDNWSRGNGWGALAIATLVRDLPLDHPKRKQVETLAKKFFKAVLKYQDQDGLWHQEMTDDRSFTETSGSGLLLYGLGIMLEKGLLEKEHIKDFNRGITLLTSYISDDGSVSHACFSCLSPRSGSKQDYINHVWVYNDPHGFGPIVLALAQASKMKMNKLSGTNAGKYAVLDTVSHKVKTYVRYVPERSEDIAWENDRIAFRYYGPPVRDKVSSGIDIWTKSVDYSIIDKWYRLNGLGLDYHVDRGEGLDFYHMGFLRGCGGTAIWRNGKPFPSQTYDTHRILRNEENGIEFELNFNTWEADGLKITEQKRISMVNGTNFFKVVSTIRADTKEDLVIGIGITTFGKPIMLKIKDQGILSSWEKIDQVKGNVGTAIVVDPKQFYGYEERNGDHYLLVKVKPGEPFTYYAGAGWAGNNLFTEEGSWEVYLQKEAGWDKLQQLYKK